MANEAVVVLPCSEGFREAFGFLEEGLENPAALQSEYLRIFGHVISMECPPYETQWGCEHIFMQSQELGDIGGFYRAWGVEVSDQAKERLDHISVELEFLSYLALKEAYAIENGEEGKALLSREAQAKFLGEHVVRWVSAFTTVLGKKAGGGFYASLARVLREFVLMEADEVGAKPQALRPMDVRPVGHVSQWEDSSCGSSASCPFSLGTDDGTGGAS
ncbi:MAG: molecular chaperone TorD family protein [Acidobacteria bacterium]|nr:molecular chaperone TorD family protein [Acidobacteriota bacterium]